jgi:hypothetical protein
VTSGAVIHAGVLNYDGAFQLRVSAAAGDSLLDHIEQVIVGKHADRGAVQIIILAAAQRPEEGRQSETAERQRQRDEDDQNCHDAGPARGEANAPATHST